MRALIGAWCLGFLMGAACTLLAGGCLIQSRPTPQEPTDPEVHYRYLAPPAHRFDSWCANRECRTREEAEI